MKRLILCMALCGSLSFCSIPSKGFDELSKEVQYGALEESHGELAHTVVLNPKVASTNSSDNTPPISSHNSPSASPKGLITPNNSPDNTQPNSVIPSPATSSRRLLNSDEALSVDIKAKFDFEVGKTQAASAAAAAATLALPKPSHIRAHSGPVNLPEIAQALNKTNN